MFVLVKDLVILKIDH